MRALAVVLALAVAGTLLIAFGVLAPGDAAPVGPPAAGAPAAGPPAAGAPAERYLAEADATTGMRNVVGAILVHFRGFDTFVEVLVIFAALMGVVGIGLHAVPSPPAAPVVPVDPVARFVVAMLAPYVALYGLALLIRGHDAPGGGFASGAVVAALIVAVAFVAKRWRIAERPRSRRPALASALAPALAPLAFAAALTLSAAGGPLGGGPLGGGPAGGGPAGPVALSRTGSLLEAAIAVSAAVVLARLFLELDRGARGLKGAASDPDREPE